MKLVLERVIATLCQTHTKIILETQFACSTILQLLEIDGTTKGYISREHITAASFGIEKEFDCLGHRSIQENHRR